MHKFLHYLEVHMIKNSTGIHVVFACIYTGSGSCPSTVLHQGEAGNSNPHSSLTFVVYDKVHERLVIWNFKVEQRRLSRCSGPRAFGPAQEFLFSRLLECCHCYKEKCKVQMCCPMPYTEFRNSLVSMSLSKTSKKCGL